MKEIIADKNLIARCGLYCGACKKYLKGSCNGCNENHKATWCKVRSCCAENNFKSCADCTTFENVRDCKKHNNFISKIFALIFSSNRAAGIDMIKREGYENFARYMADSGLQTIKNKN